MALRRKTLKGVKNSNTTRRVVETDSEANLRERIEAFVASVQSLSPPAEGSKPGSPKGAETFQEKNASSNSKPPLEDTNESNKDSETDQKREKSNAGPDGSSSSRNPINAVLDTVSEQFDGDFEDAETYDITKFDFDRLTKPVKTELSGNQNDYVRICKMNALVPNAFILQSLNYSCMALNSQQLGPKGVKALCSALASNCTVQSLEISEDEIDLEAMDNLCEMLSENSFITNLDFSNNKLGRVAVKMLVNTLATFDRVTDLNLTGNSLDDGDGDIFFNYLKSTRFLNGLNLSYNAFREEGATLLGKGFALNDTVQTLSLRWNHIRGTGATGFLAGLAKNKSVESLDISWNGLGPDGVKQVCKTLKRNSTLQTLDLSSNRINSKALNELFAAVKKSTSVVTLVVGENCLSMMEIFRFLQDILAFKGQFTLKNLNFGSHIIDYNSKGLVDRCRQEKDLMVFHGPIFGMKEKTVSDADALANLNPITVLIEFGRLLGMRIKDLFEYMDKDGSKTLSRDEIKFGLMEFDLPLPEPSLDLLIRKMDQDGDGEISITELLSTGAMHNRMRIKDARQAKFMNIEQSDTENGRCRKILKRLIAAKAKAKAAAVREKRGMKAVSGSPSKAISRGYSMSNMTSIQNYKFESTSSVALPPGVPVGSEEEVSNRPSNLKNTPSRGISAASSTRLPPISQTNMVAGSQEVLPNDCGGRRVKVNASLSESERLDP